MTTINELPELPFEHLLSYLSLKERIRSRRVSKRWYCVINSFRVECLCYSNCPIDKIQDNKERWITGKFSERNFINSTQFSLFFFHTLTIFSNLKRLRFRDVHLSKEKDLVAFCCILNSFGQLEHLDLIKVHFDAQRNLPTLNLNLPMLTSFQLLNVIYFHELILKAPRLQTVRILNSKYLRVTIVDGQSVQRLIIDCWENIDIKTLKTLQILYASLLSTIGPNFLFDLPKLKEIHTINSSNVLELFEQRRKLGRTDLLIYLCALRLNGANDPRIATYQESFASHIYLNDLVANLDRLADEVPFSCKLYYTNTRNAGPKSDLIKFNFLRRFTGPVEIVVLDLVQNTQQFLEVLKNCGYAIDLWFGGVQSQTLFEQISQHCVANVRNLTLFYPPSLRLDFLYRLKHVTRIYLNWQIEIETIRKAFEELPVLSSIRFLIGDETVAINRIGTFKQFQIWFRTTGQTLFASDLNAVIGFFRWREETN